MTNPQQHLFSVTGNSLCVILLLLFSCFFGVSSLESNSPGAPQSLTNKICTGRPRQSCDVQVDVPQACLASSVSCPIVFFFHGAGGTNTRYASTTGVHQMGYIGVYPQGEQGWNTGPKPTNNCAWHDLDCTQDPDEGDFIASIIAELRDQGANGNVYAIGTSNGAALAHQLGCNAGDELPIKGIVAKVTQLLASPERSGPGVLNYNQPRSSSPPVSVLSIMGTNDPIVPYNGGSSNVFGGENAFQLMPSLESMTTWAVHNGCDATFVLDESYATNQGTGQASKYDYSGGCPAGVIVEHYAINGGGHNSGGASINNERVDYDIAYDFIDRLESGSAGSPTAPSLPLPTLPPITSPTQSPVGTCVDDPSWSGRFNAAHTCDYIALVPEQRCGWENSDGVLASTACGEACGGCSLPNPSPTLPPVSLPTLPPIPSPTQPPVGTCVDDPSWTGRFNAAHTCDYIAQAPEQRCGWENVNGVLASTACSEACGSCSLPIPSPTLPPVSSPTQPPAGTCVDDPSWTGRFDATHTCDYIAQAPDQRCGWENDNGVLASTACGEACGGCSLPNPSPTLPPTPSPSVSPIVSIQPPIVPLTSQPSTRSPMAIGSTGSPVATPTSQPSPRPIGGTQPPISSPTSRPTITSVPIGGTASPNTFPTFQPTIKSVPNEAAPTVSPIVPTTPPAEEEDSSASLLVWSWLCKTLFSALLLL